MCAIVLSFPVLDHLLRDVIVRSSSNVKSTTLMRKSDVHWHTVPMTVLKFEECGKVRGLCAAFSLHIGRPRSTLANLKNQSTLIHLFLGGGFR